MVRRVIVENKDLKVFKARKVNVVQKVHKVRKAFKV